MTLTRFAGSSISVARLHRAAPMMFAPSVSASSRMLTGTIATSGASGSAFLLVRYALSAPEVIATATSLKDTPAAAATSVLRFTEKDFTWQFRDGPVGTLKIVRGARIKGRRRRSRSEARINGYDLRRCAMNFA